MRLRLNGEAREVPEGTTLHALIVRFGFRPEGVAAAVNGEVVRRSSHAEHALQEGDTVEVIRAVGGG